MKIVVIGGSGLIGSKVVAILRGEGHDAIAASPRTGVNAVTGEGLNEALRDARVVVDVANAPSWAPEDVLAFFRSSTTNLAKAEQAAGVAHHVALSIVGTDRMPDNGYFRAKVAQEKLVETSGVAYSIVRATQFMEFIGGIADAGMQDGKVHLSPGLFQPIAADDVAAFVADIALAAPLNGIVDIAGPDRAPLNQIIGRYLKAHGDMREIVADPKATYFGGLVEEQSLVPTGDARIGKIALEDWMKRGQE